MKAVEVQQNEAVLEHVPQMGDGPIALMVNGKPVAVIVPVEDMDLESVSLVYSRNFYDLIEQSRKSIREEGGVPIEEVRRQLGLTEKPSKRKKAS